MRFACWIAMATNTHSEYVIFTVFPLQACLRERASILRYTYIACLVFLCQFTRHYFLSVSCEQLRATDQKRLESFEMWCWRRMEKISWTDHVRNEELLLTVNEQRNILHEIRKRKANWICHILRRNCLLKQVIEGKITGEIEVTRRRGRRRKKLLNDLKDRRGYCQLKEEALDHTMWRNCFGRGFGSVVRQISDDDDDLNL